MGKSSSSKRVRQSNASSSVRRRKSDGSKSRRKKSYRRRRHDSDSSESDDERSLSPSSDSYSSSEDDYRRSRQSRSFSRKDGRKIKKRVRRNSHSFTSDEESPPSKRGKESKRKGGGSRSRRKSGRSRYGRDASGDYSSCSTCANRSSREDEYESHRGRSERRDSRAEMRDNQSKDRSGSCSSCHHCSRSSCGQDSMFSGDSRSEERATDENNSKRLRSVIVVVNAEERKGEENKEEIVYDKDDYPSSRSNDSNDDESKKDVLDTKGMFENGKGKEVVVSKLHGEPSGAGGNWQDGNQGNSRPSLGTNHEDLETMLRQRALQNLQKLWGIKKAATSHASQEPTVAAAEEPELPREDQVNVTGATSRDSSGDVAKKIRIIKEQAVYARPGMVPTGKQSGCASEGLVWRTVAGIPRQEVLSAVSPAFSNPRRTAYTWRREPALSQPPAKQLVSPQKPKPLQKNPMRTETSATTIADENPQRESALNQLPTKNLSSPMGTETTDSVSFAESRRNESASSVSPAKELSLSEIPKAFQAKPAVTETDTTASTIMSGLNENSTDQTSLNEVLQQSSLAADQSTETKGAPGTESSEKVMDVVKDGPQYEQKTIADQSTDTKGAPGTESSEKVMDVVKDGPQYEQKTMSVTRGGETIQVNYQVYIPRRTPALVRRQLKRDS